jgi:hypothetical protein
MNSALDGLRLLDFTTTIAGPHCTRLLADLGAEVIKIEAPEGDMMRTRPPLRSGASTSFGQLNAEHRARPQISSRSRSGSAPFRHRRRRRRKFPSRRHAALRARLRGTEAAPARAN